MSSQTFTWNAYESALTGPITVGATTIALDSVVGLRDDGYLVIDPDDAAKREYILFTSITGSQLEGVARGLDGSAAGAQAHDGTVVVRAVFMHQMLDDLFNDINTIETWQGNHAPGTDPHPQYLTLGEGDAAYLRLDGTTVPVATIPWNSQRLTALADPTGDTDATNRGWVNAADAAVLVDAKAYSDALDHDHATPITNHANVIDAHHNKYTDAEARAAVDNGTYLKLAGGDMAGDLDMNDFNLYGVQDPEQPNDATNKRYVDLFLPLAGGTMSGPIRLNGQRVEDVGNPNSSGDAFSQAYADGRYLRLANPAMTGTLDIDGVDSMRRAGGFIQLWNGANSVLSGNGINELYLGGIPFQGGAFDLQCDESGANRRVVYTGSARRYKKDIEPSVLVGGECLSWEPAQYRFKTEDSDAPLKHWFIADDIEAASGSQFVKYSNDEIANTDDRAMIADMVLTIQALEKRLAAVEG